MSTMSALGGSFQVDEALKLSEEWPEQAIDSYNLLRGPLGCQGEWPTIGLRNNSYRPPPYGLLSSNLSMARLSSATRIPFLLFSANRDHIMIDYRPSWTSTSDSARAALRLPTETPSLLPTREVPSQHVMMNSPPI